MNKKKYEITGMTCSACSARVEKSVKAVPGVGQVNVNLLTNSMSVEFEEDALQSEDIIHAVEYAGYGAFESGKRIHKTTNESQDREQNGKGKFLDETQKSSAAMKKRVWLSVLFLLPLMYLAMHHMLNEWFGLPVPEWIKEYFHGEQNAVIFSFTQLLLLVPILVLNKNYFTIGFKTLFRGSPNMDSLIAIGSTAALLYGIFAIYRIGYGLGYSDLELVGKYTENLYFESAGTILTLVTVGKYLETKSKGKTSLAITKLIDMAPKTAWLEKDGQVQEIPVEELEKGDVFQVKPGSSFPVDGIIIEGKTLVDESAITGESIPVSKIEGDRIVSGTVNQTGFLRCQAQKVGEDTTLSQIIALVEEASSSKAPIAKLADKIAGVFVPIVILISTLTFILWMLFGKGFEFALVSAIAVLVISCPCALGLATPVAIMVGTGKGAGLGILIKSGEALQNVSQIDIAVFDKTGTLTQGKPEVTDQYLVKEITQEEFFPLAAGMESASEHPLADAVIREAARLGITPLKVRDFTAIPGKGIQAGIEGKRYLAGNHSLMLEQKIMITVAESEIISRFAKDGKTPLLFAEKYSGEVTLNPDQNAKVNTNYEGKLLGILAVADTVKTSSARAISEFKKLGIRTIMLTGDNAVTARAIQQKLQLDEVIAEVLPQQKEENIRLLQQRGKKVLMIGDGINDAPALMRADVGVAVGAGSDIAIESADIILMHDDIMDAVTMVRLGRAVIRNIKQNLFWAFFYNVVGIPLAAGLFYPVFGWQLSPMFGAAAMSFSSIFVVTNALRLRFFQPTREKTKTEEVKMEMNGQNENKEVVIQIEGMMCEHCSKSVTKALSGIEGVESVNVDLAGGSATVVAKRSVEWDKMKEAIEEEGYTVLTK